jgi:hypothetical protein
LTPDVEVTLGSDTAHRFCLGQTNMIVAVGKKEILVRGNVNKIIGFLPAIKKISQMYKAILKERGRQDLLMV